LDLLYHMAYRHQIKLLFVFIILISGLSNAFSQTDFESKENRKIISKNKIKEVKSYLWPEEGKPGDSVLVDQMFFNTDGLCIREITSDYSSTYYYDSKGRKTKDVSKRKSNGDESIIIFHYDKKGNMIFSEKTKASGKDPFKDFLFKHQFTYTSGNEILSETWFDKKGNIQILEKIEYLPAEPDSGVTKVIKYYDKSGVADRIQKSYTNGRIVLYNIGDTKNTIWYEQFFDNNERVVKTIDHRHRGPHSDDQVEEFGHGIIVTTTVTTFYKHNSFGFCNESSTYQDGKLIEKQTWHFLR